MILVEHYWRYPKEVITTCGMFKNMEEALSVIPRWKAQHGAEEIVCKFIRNLTQEQVDKIVKQFKE